MVSHIGTSTPYGVFTAYAVIWRGGAKGSDRAGPVTFMEISPHSLRKPDLWTTFRPSMNLVSEVLF